MSDKLWIPGQSEPEGNTQELILPGGKPLGTALLDADVEPAISEASEPDSALQADAQAMAQAQARNFRKFLEGLKYPPRTIQVVCPQCKSQVRSLVFPIQDYGANPELLNMLLSGQLDTLKCSGCGNALHLNSPVMVHLPQKEFLGVVVAESGSSQGPAQTLIGQLSANFMAKVAPADRKGYMLTPRQYMSMSRLHDTLWEFQGITREMRQRQQAQMVLLQRLIAAGDQVEDLQRLLEADTNLVDRNFVLQISQMSQETPEESDGSQDLQRLLRFILERTGAGQQVRAQQVAVEDIAGKMQKGLEGQELVLLLIEQWYLEGGPEVVLALVHSAPQKFDYEFLLELSLLIETEEGESQRKSLETMRSRIDATMKALAQQRAQMQRNVYQASVSLVSGALEAQDPAALLRGQIQLLKGPFMPVLMNMISTAEKNRAMDVVQRLLHLRDLALQVQSETMEPEDCLLFQLITAKSVAESRSLMEQQKALITKELLDKMNDMAAGLQENDMKGQAQKIRSLRGQMALMR